MALLLEFSKFLGTDRQTHTHTHTHTHGTDRSTPAQARGNNNMRNPIIKDVGRGLRMLLLLYAIIHYLAAYVLHLVCMIFGTAIPTLFYIVLHCSTI